MSEAPSLPGRGIKPLVSLLDHPRLAMTVSLVVLVLGAPVAWLKGAPQYAVEAVVQVAPRYMKNLAEDQELEFQSNTQYRQFVQQQIRSIPRFDIVRDALRKLGDRAHWAKPEETERHAVERLQGALQVAAVPDTYLIRISLEGKKNDALSEIVNAITEIYLARAKVEQIYGAEDRSKNLLVRERELLDQIEAKAKRRALIAQDLSLTTFSEGTPNPYDLLVATLRTKVSDARQRRIDAEAALAAFRLHGDTNVSIRSVNDGVLNDPGLNALKNSLYKRRAELLLQMSGLRADHPVREAALREMKEIEQELSEQARLLAGDLRGNLQARFAATAEQASRVEKALDTELATLERRATEFAHLFQGAMTLTSELNQSRIELEKVRQRLNYLSVESSSLGFVRLVTPALPPENPFGPGRKKMLLMVMAAALVSGLLAPTIRDLLDQRLYTVNDVEKLAGIAPAGWQIERSDAASDLFAEEQLRRLASSLLKSRQEGHGRVFGFTGIKSGVGTTTLVLDLAVTLGRLGLKVLLIEANGFSHDPRFDTGRPGLVEFLSGQVRATQIVAPGTATLPPRVGIGGTGSGRVQLQRLDRLAELLRHWSATADFILVDMPPLLVAADAELLTRIVGNVLMVVQAGVTEKGELLRARRLLLKIDPPAVGIVVNRIKPFVGGGYLKQQMLESLTGHSAARFYSMSPLKLWVESLRLRLGRRGWWPWSRR